MADQDRARWTKLVADFEVSDLSQREFAQARGIPVSNLRYCTCTTDCTIRRNARNGEDYLPPPSAVRGFLADRERPIPDPWAGGRSRRRNGWFYPCDSDRLDRPEAKGGMPKSSWALSCVYR